MKTFISCLLSISLIACSTENPKNNNTLKVSKNIKKSVRPVQWDYISKNGPYSWCELSPKYALCGEGLRQSPINFIDAGEKKSLPIHINYEPTQVHIAHNDNMHDIIDNGHTIQLDVDDGSTFTLSGETYHLKQFHFHTPSEHTINGKHFPMEVHFVHQADDGNLAVIGVFVRKGDTANANIQMVVDNLPNQKGSKVTLDNKHVNLDLLVPKLDAIYHYSGSLTTPPCSENVEWLVIKKPIITTGDHLTAIHNKIHKNNRPTQDLHARQIVMDQIQLTED
jgi:carbonic anhydrase